MHDPAIPCRGVQISLEIACTDKIDYDVDSLATCSFEDLFGPVLRTVVEAGSGAELVGAEIDFGLAACRDVDGGGGGGFRELNTGNGDGGSAGMPEDGFALGEFTDEIERLGGRYPSLRKMSMPLSNEQDAFVWSMLGAQTRV